MRRCRTMVLAVFLCLAAGLVWAAHGDAAAQTKKPRQHAPAKSGYYGRYGAGPGAMFGPGAHMNAMAAYLNLSKEQAAKIEQIFNRSRSDNRDLRYDLIQKRIEMHRLFTDPKVNAQTLTAKERELSSLQQRLMDSRIGALIEVRSVLTPEQIRKLDEMPTMMGGMGGACGGCPMMMGRGAMSHGMAGSPAVPPCMNPSDADGVEPDNPEDQ